jgi:hypothetical protein
MYVQAPQFAQRPPAPQQPMQRPLPRPIIRAQAPDEPLPPALTRQAVVSLPAPEVLGITAAKPTSATLDLSSAHRRLEDLGATCFQIEKLAQGHRIRCLLPTREVNRTHRVEATAGTQVEAMRLVLDKAEEWSRSAASSHVAARTPLK